MGSMILSHLPALAAMVLGYVLLVVEMCIPGFGVPGVMGTALAVIGIIAMQPTGLQALILVVAFVALLCIALAICLRSAARGRISKSKLVLNEVSTRSETPLSSDLNYFVGKTGKVHSPLRPVGVADFDGVMLNVVSEGDFVEAGTPVRVARIEGKRIIVRVIG